MIDQTQQMTHSKYEMKQTDVGVSPLGSAINFGETSCVIY